MRDDEGCQGFVDFLCCRINRELSCKHNKLNNVIQKLQALAPSRLREVEDFIDFLNHRDSDRQLTQAAMAVSEPALRALWDNADDAEYDKL